MSELLSKSTQNLDSAQLLISKNYFAPSVHCSYYSTVQILIHLLLHELKFTQEKFDNDSENEGKSSHVFAINTIFTEMDRRKERLKAVDFQRQIKTLKNYRVQADYKDLKIEQSLSEDSLEKAKSIKLILQKVFSF
jgi:uncharacterized protein (UPF0332 family)